MHKLLCFINVKWVSLSYTTFTLATRVGLVWYSTINAPFTLQNCNRAAHAQHIVAKRTRVVCNHCALCTCASYKLPSRTIKNMPSRLDLSALNAIFELTSSSETRHPRVGGQCTRSQLLCHFLINITISVATIPSSCACTSALAQIWVRFHLCFKPFLTCCARELAS